VSYSVLLTSRAIEDLRAALQRFPVRSAREAVFERLRELGQNPSLGTRVTHGPLEGRMAFTFRIAWPPLARQFTAFYAFGQDEQTLWILHIAEGDRSR
jgi:hypothetical protein